MKFFERFFAVFVCLIAAAASRLSTKYLPPNYAAGSSQYPHYITSSRSNPNVGHQYSAAIAAPPHLVLSKLAHHKPAAVPIPILRSEYNNDGNGNYNFGFETGNGIKRDESAHFQGPWPAGSLKIAGSYSYTGDDGKLYSVRYKADNNGFRAEGEHLPTPPPIPREIQETLHLHQRSSKQRNSAASLTLPGGYSTGRHSNFGSGSHSSTNNVFIPNTNYLPPQQNQGYNFGRIH